MSTTVKLSKALYARVQEGAKAGGYSSADEFVEHVLEKELAVREDAESDAEIAQKLKGLGYLD